MSLVPASISIRRVRCRSSAKTAALADHALGPEEAPVALPALAVAGQAGGKVRGAAVDRMLDRLARGVAVAVAGFAIHEQDVVETAGREQAGEAAQPAEAPLPLVFHQTGMLEAGGRVPAEGHAAEIAIGDVHAAVHHHREAQAGAAAEFEHPDAALRPVGQRHQADAGELAQAPRAPGHLAAAEILTVESHAPSPIRSAGASGFSRPVSPKAGRCAPPMPTDTRPRRARRSGCCRPPTAPASRRI